MTRINVVPAAELTDKHLLAEYRELPRVFALARDWHVRGRDKVVPVTYTLGKGHVTFFYTRLAFLMKRHSELVTEMIRRGFVVRFPLPPAVNVPDDLMGDYKPTRAALRINRERIAQRLSEASQRRTSATS